MNNYIENNSFNFNQISKSRDFLFGLSIFFVVFHHLTINFTDGYLGKTYTYFHYMGAVGVDIFLFLSAIGLYYSYSKNEDTIVFYKRRFLRIFPAFFIIVIPWFFYYDIMKKGDYAWFFGHITSIGYWFKGSGDWFISAILLLYLLYPLLYKYLYKTNIKYAILRLFFLYGVLILYLKYFFPDYTPSLGQFLPRIPIFLTGMFIAPYVKNGLYLPRIKTIILSLITLITFMGLYLILALKGSGAVYCFIGRLIFLPISISLVFVIANLYKETSNLFTEFIVFIGSLSLEIYLTNERTIAISESLGKYYGFNQDYFSIVIENLIGIVSCVILSYLVHRLTNKKEI